MAASAFDGVIDVRVGAGVFVVGEHSVDVHFLRVHGSASSEMAERCGDADSVEAFGEAGRMIVDVVDGDDDASCRRQSRIPVIAHRHFQDVFRLQERGDRRIIKRDIFSGF